MPFSERFWSLFNRILPPGTPIQNTIYKVNDLVGEKYLVKGLLGIGGMGIVYLVFNKFQKSFTALKTFKEERLYNSDMRNSFKKEAEVWVRLASHPNILNAYWVEEINGRLYIEMELIPPKVGMSSSSLDSYIKAGKLDYDQIINWSIQFCLGMQHAYKSGIKCHKDIKPGNILIDGNNQVKISDFGLAEVHSIESTDKTSAPCGTPAYMPPEQFEYGDYDVKNDIYSFGVVLFEMATRRLPFMVQHSNKYPIKPSHLFNEWKILHYNAPIPAVEGDLGSIIKKCLAKERTERYGSFALLREDLLSIIGTERIELSTKASPKLSEDYQLNTQGANLAALGHYGEAIEFYEKALEINPRNAAVWTNKGFSLYNIGHLEQAISCFDRSIDIDSNNIEPWLNKGTILNTLGNYNAAIECYEQALKIDPINAAVWVSKGISFSSLGRFQESLSCFDKALEINPRYAKAWHSKGNALSGMGYYVEAIESIKKALDVDPTITLAWLNMGNYLMKLERPVSAIECYDRALEIDPNYPEAWFNKGCTYGFMSRYKESYLSFKKFIEIAPASMMDQILKAREHIAYLKSKL